MSQLNFWSMTTGYDVKYLLTILFSKANTSDPRHNCFSDQKSKYKLHLTLQRFITSD